MEIVVIDGVRRFGNGWWLPAGPMRERGGRLKSVDAVIVNGGVPRSSEIPRHLLPGQAVNLRTGTRCDVAQLEHVWRWRDWASAALFHAEDVWRTTGKMCTAGRSSVFEPCGCQCVGKRRANAGND